MQTISDLESDSPSSACNCKIGRMSGKYDREDLSRKIGEWRTMSDSPSSLRQLTTKFNKALLRAAVEDAGMSPISGETDNYYRLLTGEDVSAGDHVQIRNRLQKHEIDADELRSDFVSYQTINRHLKNCLEVDDSNPREEGFQAENAIKRIRALRNRTQAVIENTLHQLNNNSKITSDDLEVLINISIICNECGSRVGIDQIANGEGCNCTPEEE